MAKCVRRRLQSERGASLFMALMLFLVCMVVSSVVLAAATTFMGVNVTRGKSDQRYYSVSSAVKLFSSWMGEDRRVEVSALQKRTKGDDDSGTVEPLEMPTLSGQKGEAFNDVLLEATLFGLYGTDDLANATAVLASMPEDEWIEDYTAGFWTGAFSNDFKTFDVEISPRWKDETADGFDLGVDVSCRLTRDWVMYLEFGNKSDNQKYGQYTVLVTLHANADSYADESEKTTKVTWSLVGVEPGGSMQDV